MLRIQGAIDGAIKEALQEGTCLRWVPSGAQLADSSTKAMESHFLRETVRLGVYRLCDEESTLKERAKTKDRLKWLKGQQHESSSERYKEDECDLNSCCNPLFMDSLMS